MMKKLMFLAAVLVVAAAAPAAAGGWATSSLDDPPAQLVAGQDRQVGFTILQHGRTPVNPDSGDIGIRLVDTGSGQGLTFLAVQQGPVGHYVATVNVPSAGAWRWEVLQGWFESQPLGSIDVVTGAPTAAASPPPATAAPSGGVDTWRVVTVVVAALLLVAFVIELVLGRRKARTAVVAAGA